MPQVPEYISVLLVDDHEIVRSGLKRFLSTDPNIHVVAEASSGKEAIDIAMAEKPDVALVDVNMPVMDGISTAKRILIVSPKTAIIILSAHNDDTYLERAMQAGAHGYLTKEIDIKSLINSIYAVLRGEKAFSRSLLQNAQFPQGRPHPEHVANLHLPASLTQREQEVLALVTKGLTSNEIAEKLHISPRTVETHRFHLIAKLGVKNTAELVRFAMVSSAEHSSES